MTQPEQTWEELELTSPQDRDAGIRTVAEFSGHVDRPVTAIALVQLSRTSAGVELWLSVDQLFELVQAVEKRNAR